MAFTQAKMQEKRSVMDRLGPFPNTKGWIVKEWVENMKFWTEVDGYEDLRLNIFKSSLDRKHNVAWWRNLPDGSKDSWEHAEPEIMKRFVPQDDYQQELRMMWRGETLRQHIGESIRAFGEKILRVAGEMASPPDEAERILKFRMGIIPSIRKRLTLAAYEHLEQWVIAAELAEKDLLLESKGTTELTNGLLKDDHTSNYLINYHEGLNQEEKTMTGVLTLGVKETTEPEKKQDQEKDSVIAALNDRIKQLESAVSTKKNQAKNKQKVFPFKRQNPPANFSSQNQPKPQPTFKRFRNEREIAQNRLRRENIGVWCNRCRKGNHSLEDCWYNKYCSKCDKKGHTDQECYSGKERNWKKSGMKWGRSMYCISTKDEEKFSPLILFNVTSLDGQNIQEVIADTGAGISAITRTLAHKIGAVIENQSGRRRIWQANGTEFSYTGQTKIAIKIEGEIFSINCFVFEELAFDLIIGNNVLKTRQAVVRYNPEENEQLFLAADNGRIVEVTGSSGDLGWKVRNVAFLLRSSRNYLVTPGESKVIEVEIVEWEC